jgi:hypothetical protein
MMPLFADSTHEFYDFYAANLRTGLFSGFLTLAGFLLTAMTLTVIQIKKELCDRKGYLNRVRDSRASTRQSNEERIRNGRKPRSETSHFGGLLRLGGLIWGTIVCALFTAICQYTVGILYKEDASAYICLGVAGTTVLLLLTNLFFVGRAILDMFTCWEAEAVEEERQLTATGS